MEGSKPVTCSRLALARDERDAPSAGDRLGVICFEDALIGGIALGCEEHPGKLIHSWAGSARVNRSFGSYCASLSVVLATVLGTIRCASVRFIILSLVTDLEAVRPVENQH